jgi:dihydrofolate reductase
MGLLAVIVTRPTVDFSSNSTKSKSMSKLRVQSFTISIDGFGAGPGQDLQNPLGVRGPELMEWFFHTRAWRRMHGHDDGETGVDNTIAEEALTGLGAWILGRNMFGPIRGAWPDERWKGWWGDEPPYHTPVFVLTHHPRASLSMAGGTTFHFVTGGIHAALEQATAAAGHRDVRVGGGVATIRQYLRAALIDEMHLALRPVLLGTGEHLLRDIDLRALGYECVKYTAGERATHVLLRKSAQVHR